MKGNNKETQNEQPLVVMNISYISFNVILEINLLIKTNKELGLSSAKLNDQLGSPARSIHLSPSLYS